MAVWRWGSGTHCFARAAASKVSACRVGTWVFCLGVTKIIDGGFATGSASADSPELNWLVLLAGFVVTMKVYCGCGCTWYAKFCQ
jgi:hypothetical protein